METLDRLITAARAGGAIRRACLIGLTLLTGLAFGPARAGDDNYPSRSIDFIIPVPAGASVDTTSRFIGRALADVMGVTVVAQNIGGAAGGIGTAKLVRSAPDGYTMLLASNGVVAILPAINSNLGYDPIKDLVPVSQVMKYGLILVANPNAPFTDLQGLIAHAKANPGKVVFAHTGIGSVSHLATEQLKKMADIDIRQVPYVNASMGLTDLIAGRVMAYFFSPAEAVELGRDGRGRLLAISSTERIPLAPDVPTVSESGLPGFDITVAFNMYLPAKTPPAIVKKLEEFTRKATDSPTLKAALESRGVTVVGSTAEELVAITHKDIETYGKLLQDAGVEKK